MSDPKAFIRKVGRIIGESNIVCKDCNNVASYCEETTQHGYDSDECFEFICSTACKSRGWAFCKLCNSRFGKGNIKDHQHSQRHTKRKAEQVAKSRKLQKVEHHGANINDEVIMENLSSNEMPEMMSFENDEAIINQDSDNNPVVNASTEKSTATISGAPDVDSFDRDVMDHPRINMVGNEWMAKAFQDLPLAKVHHIRTCFGNMDVMSDYWTAEHASPPGRCGGGIRYLVAKTFQNASTGIGLSKEKTPRYVEARWHLDYFMQYNSMDEKQRQRQARITKSIMDHAEQQKGGFFQHTYIPEYRNFSKVYGKTGKNSVWNNLPIPSVENIDGVAYVSPIDIIKYLFANGVPVDDMLFHSEHLQGTDFDTDNNKEVFIETVSQCQRTAIWMQELEAKSHKEGSKMKKAVLLWGCDWKDGFGPSRVKNNRGSVDAMTITLAPPKGLVNATENTFLVAVGLKRYKKGWTEVSHRFREDVRKLSVQEEPFYLYHGVLQKMIPVCFRRYVSIEDKVERPETTQTIGCTSDIHRCFGVLGKIQTPKCDVGGVKDFLAAESTGIQDSQWGWCDQFIDRTEGKNGANFPSCNECRKRSLWRLGVKSDYNAGGAESEKCKDCADWKQYDPADPPSFLQFPAPAGYPHVHRDDCPMESPKGREPGVTHLPQIQLSFPFLIHATKYAFFHLCNKGWNMTNTKCYLNTCGVSDKLCKEITKAAIEARGNEVDYDDKEFVGSFRFPAPWLSELAISDYIETIMHLLMLGIAQTLFTELTTDYLKSCNASAAFRKEVQPLLEDLKKFQLSWLLVFPFAGDKDTTGGWVSENWLAFVRIMPILYGWLDREKPAGLRQGFQDVARVVLSFHAVVARCMTHGGINPKLIDDTEFLMREFLSAVRELDVRVNHTSVGQATKADAFWQKPNYMSLLNLVDMMISLGPLILWWDGGGKGEKFIQEIKPHIRRGVREDYNEFFVQLTRKMYRVRQILYTEKRLGLQPHVDFDEDYDGGVVSLVDLINALEVDDSESDDEATDEDDSNLKGRRQGEVTDAEDSAMFKDKTIYVYRKESVLNDSIAHRKPIAGILQVVTKENGAKAFEFLTVCRKPVKKFARHLLTFNDAEGVHFHGMWYAPIQVAEQHVQVADRFYDIQESGKMAAVAIPLRYTQPGEHGDKYCVITNWWKVRIKGGDYVLPGLDPSMYTEGWTDDAPPHVEVRDGHEYAAV